MLTYKFRLYPTKTQEKKLEETLEICRRSYNRMLDDRIRNHTSFFEQKKLVELKREDKYLKSVHSQVLQDVVLRLDKAFQSYFAGLSRFPKFRRRVGVKPYLAEAEAEGRKGPAFVAELDVSTAILGTYALKTLRLKPNPVTGKLEVIGPEGG